jgi:hypothetical protein
MGQSQTVNGPGHAEACDTVITNALIIDHWGIVKADIGLKDGRIAAIGKAGNPDTQPGVDVIIGAGTEIIAGEGLIVTAGGIDAHIHFICPQQIEEALVRHHHHARRRHRPGHRHLRHHLHARPLAHAPHAAGGRGLSDEHGFLRQGQRHAARGAGRTGQRRRHRPQAARGLGHHAQRPSQLPDHGGRSPTSRWPSTPTRSTRAASWKTPSPPSRAAPSTPSTPRARAAATRPTS